RGFGLAMTAQAREVAVVGSFLHLADRARPHPLVAQQALVEVLDPEAHGSPRPGAPQPGDALTQRFLFLQRRSAQDAGEVLLVLDAQGLERLFAGPDFRLHADAPARRGSGSAPQRSSVGRSAPTRQADARGGARDAGALDAPRVLFLPQRLQFALRILQSALGTIDVDLLHPLGTLREHGDVVVPHLDEAAAHEVVVVAAARRVDELAGLHHREIGRV